MKKNTVHKIMIPIMLVLVITQAVTGLFRVKFSHDVFEIFHEGGGIVLVCLILLHLILNFNWVRASYFQK